MNKAPEISVGIVSGRGLTFTLNGHFTAGVAEKSFRSVDRPA